MRRSMNDWVRQFDDAGHVVVLKVMVLSKAGKSIQDLAGNVVKKAFEPSRE